jgi:hypothetical protein
LFVSSACGKAEASASQNEAVAEPTLVGQLSEDPLVDIGRVDGDADYLLHNAVSSLRLSDGRTVILNAGSHQLRFYDDKGRHLKSVGTRGSGPGEFRRPIKLYLPHQDSIVVLDVGTSLETVFDGQANLVRAIPYVASEADRFPREVWLHDRAYIDGPMKTEDREPVRKLLDRLPPLAGTPHYRYVKVDAHGRIWVRRAPADSGSALEWSVYRVDGSAIARIVMPAGFEVQHIGTAFVLGRATDELNVEHIRLYTVTGVAAASGQTAAGSAMVSSHPKTIRSDTEPELQRMRFALRHLMTQQEIFYSQPANGYRYSDRADQLEWPEDMQGLVVHILEAGPSGWSALVFHETEPITCGLGVGLHAPVGWKPGVVVCT